MLHHRGAAARPTRTRWSSARRPRPPTTRSSTRFRAADHAFTVDPVDGTKNFVSRLPGPRRDGGRAARRRGACAAGSGSPSTRRRTSPSAAGGAWRNGERLVRPPVGAEPRGVTSRRRWIGRALDGLPPLELTWVCCGVDYPKLVEGAADYLIYARHPAVGPRPGVAAPGGGRRVPRHLRGRPYRPQDPPPAGLVGAADRATYDRVQELLGELAPTCSERRPRAATRGGSTQARHPGADGVVGRAAGLPLGRGPRRGGRPRSAM